MIFTAGNRLRGTYGWFASVFGIVLTAVMYWITKDLTVSMLIGVGYWFGEMICGWGDHIGVVTVHRWKKFKDFPEDGENVGVRWLTSMIVYPRLWRLHLSNAKIGIRNIVPKIMNTEVKGWSLARLLKKEFVVVPIVPFEIDNALRYSRVFLVIRGLYWWALPMLGVSVLVGVVPAVVALLALSLGWPIAAELGYWIGEVKKKQIHKWVLSYAGGWEWQEGMYGVLQDLVVIGLVVSYVVN